MSGGGGGQGGGGGGLAASENEVRSDKEFELEQNLLDAWTTYTANSDEKYFRKFVKGFVGSWEKKISSSWENTVTSCLNNSCEVKLASLPDELLPALSKFLIISKDAVDMGNVDGTMVSKARDIVNCLTIACRNTENIPLVASMDFVKTLTHIASILLQNLLHLESTFFTRKAKKKAEAPTKSLREEIMAFIINTCHFFEALYDPHFRWRAYLCGKSYDNLEATPVAIHQAIVPFLYESFETALVECFPDLGLEMLTVLGAIISGARHNAIRAISPATSKMLLKTVRDSETSQVSK